MTERYQKKWTTREVKRLREAWPTLSRDELLKRFPGRSFYSVRHMAEAMKLRRPNRLYGYIRDWKKITAEHNPSFNFPTGVIR